MNNNELKTEKKWYALYTRPRSEFKAASQLSNIKVEYYLPQITVLRQWSDRKKKVREPLIKSYIFIKANEKERLLAVEEQAIIRCLFYRGKPASIPEFEIENLRNFVKEEYEYKVINEIVKGSKIKITEGPMAGVEGVVINEDDNKAIAVSIEILNRTVITYIKDTSILELLK